MSNDDAAREPATIQADDELQRFVRESGGTRWGVPLPEGCRREVQRHSCRPIKLDCPTCHPELHQGCGCILGVSPDPRGRR